MGEPRRYAGVVPSSGASTRMGRDKGLLDIGGRSFLERTVSSLSDGGCDPVVVVVAEGEEALAAEGAAAGAVVLTNPTPGDGPITSLRLALAELGDTVAGVAYLPVDHPLVRADTVRTLLNAARTSAAPLVVPTYRSERGHPAVFGSAVFQELLEPHLEAGAKTVVHRHLGDALLVEVDDEGIVLDIDTPAAYEAAVGGRLPGPRGGS